MWYEITNIDQIDSPALAVYPDRIQHNIDLAIQTVGNANRLRPHVKTNKISEVCLMMINSGITKFKCATIAEAEMLATIKAPDVLLAYQPVGPKIARLINLVKKYPETRFSCLIDNEQSGIEISSACLTEDVILDVYLDVNVGMNRTGVSLTGVTCLAEKTVKLPGLTIRGVHAYDGHINDRDFDVRKQQADSSYQQSHSVLQSLQKIIPNQLTLIIGGTPAFSIHAKRSECECSPGTFVFWDWGYKLMIEELPFQYAAVVISRVISVIDQHHICIDLGYKAVAAESPLPRLHFLNAPDAIQASHSEEHLVLKVTNNSTYPIGTILYAIPLHICPTIALYNNVHVIEDKKYTTNWDVIARKR
ncbi:D-TA family PLP-dependent enzyme [Bacteroides sp. 519]|uniref:D-TA family PLP-dependent enzyme n=1 Tax=Bacteroides sp. 519 TaxID=2302937 RepID=UPI0013D44EEB|nr:D-TA family PLP-dependent enzyme [Bacteroides sp. 519]NDV60018.1 D-TA family PLP-dependent enzyme [Bacteroides sp. 519]